MRRRAREKGLEEVWGLVLDVTGLGFRDMVYVWQTLVGVPSLRDCASDGGVKGVWVVHLFVILCVVCSCSVNDGRRPDGCEEAYEKAGRQAGLKVGK